MVNRPAGIVQIDGRQAQAVARRTDRVGSRRIKRGRHLCNLAALRRELDKQRDMYLLFNRADDLRHHTGLAAEAGPRLLAGAGRAARGKRNIVRHIRTAHIQFNNICAHGLKLFGHIDPPGSAAVSGIGDIGHEDQIV